MIRANHRHGGIHSFGEGGVVMDWRVEECMRRLKEERTLIGAMPEPVP